MVTMHDLTEDEADYVGDNPGLVHTYRDRNLVASVPLPPTAEPENVTRARLWLGVCEAFCGTSEDAWDDLATRVETGPLVVIETSLIERRMAVQLSP